ncbi:MAG: hypothetical protein AB7S26_42930, partial [Sandaracinaceae bacterium]
MTQEDPMRANRTIKRVGMVALLVGVTALAWSCDVGEMTGDAMVDAAGLMRDAGGALMDAGNIMRDAATDVRDGSSNDAAAQVPINVSCDIERTRRIETAPDNWNETTFYYAEIRDPSIATTTAVRWAVCGA